MIHGEPPLKECDLPSPSEFANFHPFIKGVFSQWHPTAFVIDNCRFSTAEQWMMLSKARLFGDAQAAEAILGTSDPDQQKRLGQRVRGFVQDEWDRWKVSIVYRGNLAKFEQNEGAARQLRATGDVMLVEANPRDWIWGIGLAVGSPLVCSPSEWKGANLLGRILTKVRGDLS